MALSDVSEKFTETYKQGETVQRAAPSGKITRVTIQRLSPPSDPAVNAARPASNRATGTRNGEHET